MLSLMSYKSFLTYANSIKEAVQEADIVTVHIPASKDSNYLFDDALFNEFKPGSVFINCARGSIVKTSALVHALDNGILKGQQLIHMNGKRIVSSDQRQTGLRMKY